jgi:long-chain acyl-CoA synthetase
MAVGINYRPTDVLVSYLPYSHLFERMQLTLTKLSGCSVGYITGDINLLQDVAELAPTIFHSAPRLFNYLFDRANEVIENCTPFQKIYVKAILDYK